MDNLILLKTIKFYINEIFDIIKSWQIMANLEKDKNTFRDISRVIAERSTCKRVKVGAVLVKEGRIVVTGWNGVPAGFKHCNEVHDEFDDVNSAEFRAVHAKFSEDFELHAEMNCIAFAAKHGIAVGGADMYVTVSPCRSCAKLLIAAGIRRIFYVTRYDRADLNGIELLELANVHVEQIF